MHGLGQRRAPRTRPAPGAPAGMTLIELLVVVAVIGLLMSLLAPGLAGARGSAQRAACASNLRQLSLALDLYAEDHRGHYAPGAADSLANRSRWHGARAGATGAFTAAGGALTPYLAAGDEQGATDAVRACPSFTRELERLRTSGEGFEASAGGYGYNNAFVGVLRRRFGAGDAAPAAWGVQSDRTGSPRHLFARPGSTIAFADAAFAGDRGIIEYSFVEPRFWPDMPGNRADPSTHFRHLGTAGVLWLDGHVSAEKLAFSWSSGLYAAAPERLGIGWPGEGGAGQGADDNGLFDYR